MLELIQAVVDVLYMPIAVIGGVTVRFGAVSFGIILGKFAADINKLLRE